MLELKEPEYILKNIQTLIEYVIKDPYEAMNLLKIHTKEKKAIQFFNCMTNIFFTSNKLGHGGKKSIKKKKKKKKKKKGSKKGGNIPQTISRIIIILIFMYYIYALYGWIPIKILIGLGIILPAVRVRAREINNPLRLNYKNSYDSNNGGFNSYDSNNGFNSYDSNNGGFNSD